MNAEGLLAHYAQIADAPDAIAKLRRFVLGLAVRGKLVAQDIGDQPASVLLERIDDERRRLAERGQLQQGKVASAFPLVQAPYEIPRGWKWVAVGAVVNSHVGGGTPSKNNSTYWDGDIFWASVKDVGKGKYIDQTIDKITAGGLAGSSSNVVSPGHLIVVTRMGLGKISINRVPIAINQDLRALALSSLISIDYCYLFFLTHGFEGSGLTVKGIKVEELLATPFPLPPLEEQHRIVVKVDELMALCDQLEAARAQREATRNRLAAASLARLNAPNPDTFPADARFALDALPALTTRPDQIKHLRQTILNLAVRGKLIQQIASVAQHSPSELTGRKGLPPIVSSEIPFDIPSSWSWVRLGNVAQLINGDRSKNYPNRNEYVEEGIAFINTGHIQPDGSLSLSGMHYLSRAKFDSLRAGKIQPGDLVYCLRGATLGKTAFVAPFTEGAIASSLVILRLDRSILPRYAYQYLTSPLGRELIRRFDNGTAQPNLSANNVGMYVMPRPPLAEQHRIVAKVDELMALCDQLEASLTTGETTRRRLLDALLHEALVPVAKASSEHPRAAVSGYVISRLASRRNFGRTAHMKHLYFAESRLGLNLGGRYMREAAGPLDTGIYELEKQAEAAGWYTTSIERLASGNGKVSYTPGKALRAIAEEGIAVLGPSRAEMDRLIDLMGGLKTEHVEIIATLFAAWNDALLDGHSPDDDWIIKEVREHWHVSKQRFAPADLHKWLGWMRQNDVVPLGHPPRTMQQTTMEL